MATAESADAAAKLFQLAVTHESVKATLGPTLMESLAVATLQPHDVLLLEPDEDEQDELLRLVGRIAELKADTDSSKGAIDV